MSEPYVLTTLDRALSWARSSSLWFFSTGAGCCADEVLQSQSCRYDLERFGCLRQEEPGQADLLIVSSSVSYKSAPHLCALYDSMLAPKYVLAIGACACSGGLFGPERSYSSVAGVDRLLPVDVYVPGCPPRPEAIMHGLITLQEKISGTEKQSRTTN